MTRWGGAQNDDTTWSQERPKTTKALNFGGGRRLPNRTQFVSGKRRETVGAASVKSGRCLARPAARRSS